MKEQKENFLYKENPNYVSPEEKKLNDAKEKAQAIIYEASKIFRAVEIPDQIPRVEIPEMLHNPQLYVIKKMYENMGDLKVPGLSININKDKIIEMMDKPAMDRLIELTAEFSKIESYFKLDAYTVKDNIIEISPEVLNKIRELDSVKADTPEKQELLKIHEELLKNLNRLNELFHKITGERAFYHTLGAGKLIPQMFLYNEKENTLELKSYYYKENAWRFKR